MPGDDNGNGLRFRPSITRPTPQTPELPFRPYDPANPNGKQNKPRASSKEVSDLEAHPTPTNMASSHRTFDATAAPVPQQLSYHFYASFRPASGEQSLDRESRNEVTRQTVPEETIAERAHVPNTSQTETPHIPKVRSGPAAKESEAGRDSGLKKGLAIEQERYHSPEEPEKLTVLQRILRRIETSRPVIRKARGTELDGSLNPNISIDVPVSSRTRAKKQSSSMNIADTQTAPRTIRSKASNQRKRQNEDDTDDDEEKLQMPPKKKNGTTRLQGSAVADGLKTKEGEAPEIGKSDRDVLSDSSIQALMDRERANVELLIRDYTTKLGLPSAPLRYPDNKLRAILYGERAKTDISIRKYITMMRLRSEKPLHFEDILEAKLDIERETLNLLIREYYKKLGLLPAPPPPFKSRIKPNPFQLPGSVK